MRRFTAAFVTALLATAALAVSALGDHSTVDLVSTGASGGNGAFAVFYRGASDDGVHVFFETSEKLVPADTDSRVDVYDRAGGTTTLVSTGSSGGNGGFNAFYSGASSDGLHVFFGTAEKLDPSDTDTQTDIYERTGGTTTRVSTGPNGGNGAFPAFFDGTSIGGSRVFFHTAEKLDPADTDSQSDIYERLGGTTTRVSTGSIGGNGAFPAFFDGSSENGSHVYFETAEPLEPSDVDAQVDVYDRSAGSTTHVSTGSIGGNGASDAFFDGNSSDGSLVFFTTDEPLAPGDVDANYDVYQRAGAALSRLSTGLTGGNRANDALFVGASDDGSRVFMQTDESLEGEDGDVSVDVYQRASGSTALLSGGLAGGGGLFDATFVGASSDGSHVFFETDEILMNADSDSQTDVYEHTNGATSLVSTGPVGGNGAFDSFFAGASSGGGRVFFTTDEALTSVDTDNTRDIYERQFPSVTTRVSGNLTGAEQQIPASWAGASGDGTRVFFTTTEQLVESDTDSSQDIYVASPSPLYPRPGGASPLRVPLVPAFAECTASNSRHIAPLDLPSCSSPSLQSPLLKTSTVGRGVATARFNVMPGNAGTPADEADLAIMVSATDVQDAATGGDYTGKVILSVPIRITDRANSSFATTPATVQDSELDVPVDCTATANPVVGSSCGLVTTADTLVPDMVKEGKRTVISTFEVRVLDAGPDAAVDPGSGCPPACGTGDEQPFLVQGLFAP
jgi:hypothetical protein